jgi:hypothetical protein
MILFSGFRDYGFLWQQLFYMNWKNIVFTKREASYQILISFQGYTFYHWVNKLLVPYQYCANSILLALLEILLQLEALFMLLYILLCWGSVSPRAML